MIIGTQVAFTVISAIATVARGEGGPRGFRSRHRFVDWDRTETWLDSFSRKSLGFIFSKRDLDVENP